MAMGLRYRGLGPVVTLWVTEAAPLSQAALLGLAPLKPAWAGTLGLEQVDRQPSGVGVGVGGWGGCRLTAGGLFPP